MSQPVPMAITLLPGARGLLEIHASALPQRDDLCGAFCGALALGAAGLTERGGEPLDQDAVAVAAGSVISGKREHGILPDGESGRRDYRLQIPQIENSDLSGTTAAGVHEAIAELSAGTLCSIPITGPWSAETLSALFERAAELERPVALIANFATHHLWGSHAGAAELLAYLLDGRQLGPSPDWRVGHFACVVGRVSGPRGCLYAVADTYPALGNRGVHMQPAERLAAALERADMPAGGMLAIAFDEEAETLRAGVLAAGLREGLWDNGTIRQESSV